jgi:structural maintenance of chromosome 4
MRQEKLSGLVHSSINCKPSECSVEVHFQYVSDKPTNDVILSPPDLVISRNANSSNKSQYFINFKLSSYSEVTDLLRHKGIDLDHKRFLILQVTFLNLLREKLSQFP